MAGVDVDGTPATRKLRRLDALREGTLAIRRAKQIPSSFVLREDPRQFGKEGDKP